MTKEEAALKLKAAKFFDEFFQKNKITQREAAKAINISESTISNAFNQNKYDYLTLDTIIKLADYYGLLLDDVFGRNDITVNSPAAAFNALFLADKYLKFQKVDTKDLKRSNPNTEQYVLYSADLNDVIKAWHNIEEVPNDLRAGLLEIFKKNIIDYQKTVSEIAEYANSFHNQYDSNDPSNKTMY